MKFWSTSSLIFLFVALFSLLFICQFNNHTSGVWLGCKLSFVLDCSGWLGRGGWLGRCGWLSCLLILLINNDRNRMPCVLVCLRLHVAVLLPLQTDHLLILRLNLWKHDICLGAQIKLVAVAGFCLGAQFKLVAVAVGSVSLLLEALGFGLFVAVLVELQLRVLARVAPIWYRLLGDPAWSHIRKGKLPLAHSARWDLHPQSRQQRTDMRHQDKGLVTHRVCSGDEKWRCLRSGCCERVGNKQYL